MQHLLIDHGAGQNLGDVAMLEVMLHALRDRFADASLYVRDCPLELESWKLPNLYRKRFRILRPDEPVGFAMRSGTSRKLAVRWRNRQALSRLGKTMDVDSLRVEAGSETGLLTEWAHGYEGLIVSGGGFLTDVFPDPLWQRLALISWFTMHGRPVVLSGQQIGPFHSRQARLAAERVLSKVTFLSARDPSQSADFCSRVLTPDAYTIAGDDSTGLAPDDPATALRDSGIGDDKFIAVNLRTGYYTPTYERHLSKFASVITDLAGRVGAKILIVPITLGAGDSDAEAGMKMLKRMPGADAHLLAREHWTSRTVKGVMGRACGAVGTSYHFCIFALQQQVPAVIVYDNKYYRQKAEGICQLWGDDRLAMSLRTGSAGMLSRLEAVFTDANTRPTLEQRAEELRNLWARGLDQTLGHLTQHQNAADAVPERKQPDK